MSGRAEHLGRCPAPQSPPDAAASGSGELRDRTAEAQRAKQLVVALVSPVAGHDLNPHFASPREATLPC